MGEETAADDQDPLVAKRSQTATDVVELFGVEAGHRDLQHRHISVGIHHSQRDVGTVVEPPILFLGDGLIG